MRLVVLGGGESGVGTAILGKKKGFEIDHINRNPLDNRKENLRFVTKTQNQDSVTTDKTISV
jgi:UDP-N-acetylmuramoylalanine--D-glutamate ligase